MALDTAAGREQKVSRSVLQLPLWPYTETRPSAGWRKSPKAGRPFGPSSVGVDVDLVRLERIDEATGCSPTNRLASSTSVSVTRPADRPLTTIGTDVNAFPEVLSTMK